MKELRTEIEINAAPEKVWQVLTSLDKYPAWNPLIRRAIGTLKVVPNKEFCWKYHLILRGE